LEGLKKKGLLHKPHLLAEASKDERENWSNIPDETLEKYDLVWVEPKSYRFYLPAYLCWTIRHHKECPGYDNSQESSNNAIHYDKHRQAIRKINPTVWYRQFEGVPYGEWFTTPYGEWFTTEQIRVLKDVLDYGVKEDLIMSWSEYGLGHYACTYNDISEYAQTELLEDPNFLNCPGYIADISR